MKMDKKLSASKEPRPTDPQQGLCLWTPLRAPTPDPRYRLELRARRDPPPPPGKYWIRPCSRISHFAMSYLEVTITIVVGNLTLGLNNARQARSRGYNNCRHISQSVR